VLWPGIDGEDGHDSYGAPYGTEADVDDGVVKGKTDMAATTYRKHPVSFVRFWRREKNGVRCIGEGGERKEDLTRNRSNTSGSPGDDGGGRKPRRSLAVGEDKDEEVDDFELDSLRASDEEIQSGEGKLLVALAWRGEAGGDGTPAFCSRAKPSPFSFVEKGKGRECRRCRCVCGEESSTSREKGRVEGSRWGVSSCHDCGLPCANREHLLEILRRASERFGLSGRWPYLDYKDSGLTISRKFEIDLQEGKKRALKRKEERFYNL
jgi:hypothetical protein